MTRYSRVSTMLVAIAVALLASACGAGPTARSSAVPTVMPYLLTDLKAGTYSIEYPLMDTPGHTFPKVVVTVPAGWRDYSKLAVQSRVGTPRQIAVAFWDVVGVYANGCHWLGVPLIDPGPTVDGLAAVLAARPLRNATAPVAVSLGGYQGKYLEWSVPADINFSDCDMGPGDTTGVFESWTGYGTGGGDRYQLGPGQVDRLWILDVEGRRLVIDANYMPGSTTQDRAELQQVADSIRFES